MKDGNHFCLQDLAIEKGKLIGACDGNNKLLELPCCPIYLDSRQLVLV